MSQPKETKFAFDVQALQAARRAAGQMYHEFLRVPSMSAGLYVIPADGTDPQQPHNEDEIYYIVSGKGHFTYDGQDVAVEAGSVLYVPKQVEHRFHTVEEDLTILVFFAPAES